MPPFLRKVFRDFQSGACRCFFFCAVSGLHPLQSTASPSRVCFFLCANPHRLLSLFSLLIFFNTLSYGLSSLLAMRVFLGCFLFWIAVFPFPRSLPTLRIPSGCLYYLGHTSPPHPGRSGSYTFLRTLRPCSPVTEFPSSSFYGCSHHNF